MAAFWTPDARFLDLIADKEVLTAMLAEIGGAGVAAGHAKTTAKAKREAIQTLLANQKGETRWSPAYMREWPMAAYTERGGIAAKASAEALAETFASTPKTKR